jgi:hypothetical protein
MTPKDLEEFFFKSVDDRIRECFEPHSMNEHPLTDKIRDDILHYIEAWLQTMIEERLATIRPESLFPDEEERIATIKSRNIEVRQGIVSFKDVCINQLLKLYEHYRNYCDRLLNDAEDNEQFALGVEKGKREERARGEAVEYLRTLEWARWLEDDKTRTCPCCRVPQNRLHANDCRLAEIIGAPRWDKKPKSGSVDELEGYEQ